MIYLLTMLTAASAQFSLAGSGAVSWDGAFGLTLPGLASAVSITGESQVTVTSAVSVGDFTFGAEAETGTKLLVESSFACSSMTWANGGVEMTAAGSFKPSGVVTVKANADASKSDKKCSGGKIEMGANAKIMLEADAKMAFEGVIVAGGNVEAAAGSTITLMAANSVSAATTFKGEGSLIVEGSLQASAAFTAECETKVQANAEVAIDAGVQASFSTLTYASSNCKTKMKAGANSITKVTASGKAQLNGALTLDMSGYTEQPKEKVTIMTAGSIEGEFSSVTIQASWSASADAGAGRRLLGNGGVGCDAKECWYDPDGSGSGSLTVSLGLVALLASIVTMFSS